MKVRQLRKQILTFQLRHRLTDTDSLTFSFKKSLSSPIMEGVIMHECSTKGEEKESRCCLFDGWIGNKCAYMRKRTVPTLIFFSGK